MSRLLLTPVTDEARDDDEGGERVLVLVDGSPETLRALRRAIRLSADRLALLTILAYAPGPAQPEDAETRRAGLLLAEAQAEAEVEGVAAERYLLHGPNPLDQLYALVAPAPSRDLLVLCGPGAVEGPLRPLTRTLVRRPPCDLYVLPPESGRLRRWRWRALGWLALRGAARGTHR